MRFLPVGDAPPFRRDIRDGIAYELEPPDGSIPPRQIGLGISDSGESIAPLSLGRISKPLKVANGAGPLILRDLTKTEDSESWLSVNRPESGDFLVMLWRGNPKSSWKTPKALVVPDSIQVAPAGAMRVINLSPVAIGVSFGDKNVKLETGKIYRCEVPLKQEMGIELSAVDRSGKLKRFHTGAVFQNPNERTLVVIYRADGVSPRRPLKAIIHREPVTKPKKDS